MILRLLSFTTLAILVFAAPAEAAKGAKKSPKGGAKSGRVLVRFDRDHNGVIDGEEVPRLQAAYARLAELDSDHNGQLSDAEIAAVKVPVGKRAAARASAAAPVKPSTPAAPAPAPKPE